MSQIPSNQRPIDPSDWKAFKRIRARALDRFARRTLDACRDLLDEEDLTSLSPKTRASIEAVGGVTTGGNQPKQPQTAGNLG